MPHTFLHTKWFFPKQNFSFVSKYSSFTLDCPWECTFSRMSASWNLVLRTTSSYSAHKGMSSCLWLHDQFRDADFLERTFSDFTLLNQKSIKTDFHHMFIKIFLKTTQLVDFCGKTKSVQVVSHPLSRDHFSLKNEERDQTIWNCILGL